MVSVRRALCYSLALVGEHFIHAFRLDHYDILSSVDGAESISSDTLEAAIMDVAELGADAGSKSREPDGAVHHQKEGSGKGRSKGGGRGKKGQGKGSSCKGGPCKGGGRGGGQDRTANRAKSEDRDDQYVERKSSPSEAPTKSKDSQETLPKKQHHDEDEDEEENSTVAYEPDDTSSTEEEVPHSKEPQQEEPPGNTLLWSKIRAKLAHLSPISMTVGTASGRKFMLNHGRFSSSSASGFSFGKWCGAVAVAGAVADGHLTFDTKANAVFDWWTKREDDKRSNITLRHFLTFTSGFTAADVTIPGMSSAHHTLLQPCLNPFVGGGETFWSLEQCAQQIYKTATHKGEPGRIFDYDDYHMQLAFAMASKKTGLDPQAYLKKYLYVPAGMNSTSYGGGRRNPFISGGIVSNMNDIDSFVRRYMNYELLPKKIIREMDTEYVQANKVVVHSTRSVEFTKDQEFAMAHVVAKGYKRGQPKVYKWVPLNVEIVEWAGLTGWMGYIDRTTDVYIAVVCGIHKAHHPIQWVWKDVYAALGKKLPEKNPSAASMFR